ncbi:MAG TPA: hypothetical protein VFA22_00140 [Stellaceae bacterium]|nr:hypothetical protein [Stellaceae bacterium]
MGLSFGKLLLLAAIVVAVWSAFKYAQRIEAIRRAVRREMEARRAGQAGGPAIRAEDLVKCRVCGTYVAARGTTACGRTDCPWGR